MWVCVYIQNYIVCCLVFSMWNVISFSVLLLQYIYIYIYIPGWVRCFFYMFHAILYFKYFIISSQSWTYGGVNWCCFLKDQILPTVNECFISDNRRFPWSWFVFKAYVNFLEMSLPVLCITFIDNSWAFHIINFFCCYPCTQCFFQSIA